MIIQPTPRMSLLRRYVMFLAILATGVGVHPASAAPRGRTADSSEREVARCIKQASAGKVWLEKTLWGLRDQEGGWIGAEIANTDGSHDLGPLQVNSWWVEKIAAVTGASTHQVRWWLINDACFNIDSARWIFLSGLANTGDYWKAIGVYHSPTNWRQRRYADLVASKLIKRFGTDIFNPRNRDVTR